MGSISSGCAVLRTVPAGCFSATRSSLLRLDPASAFARVRTLLRCRRLVARFARTSKLFRRVAIGRSVDSTTTRSSEPLRLSVAIIRAGMVPMSSGSAAVPPKIENISAGCSQIMVTTANYDASCFFYARTFIHAETGSASSGSCCRSFEHRYHFVGLFVLAGSSLVARDRANPCARTSQFWRHEFSPHVAKLGDQGRQFPTTLPLNCCRPRGYLATSWPGRHPCPRQLYLVTCANEFENRGSLVV
jgi:hypothetical protein